MNKILNIAFIGDAERHRYTNAVFMNMFWKRSYKNRSHLIVMLEYSDMKEKQYVYINQI